MVTVKEEMRKGPWTEKEDLQLVCFVRLFGERRWDFIAKVSGLNRTGKSCRLRWVNYLHPGLKRGRMTPQEERLILELHSRWGNRWSRIARNLPGRTDNEIKNYWRTHMRKKAQEYKKNTSTTTTSSASSAITVYSSSSGELPTELATESTEFNSSSGCNREDEDGLRAYSMDQIWNEIDKSEAITGLTFLGGKDEGCGSWHPPVPSDALWKYCSDSLWKMDDDELCMLLPGMDRS